VKRRFSKRKYGRRAERTGESLREMRAMMVESGGIGEFRKDTQRKEIIRGQKRKW
jgi:hypothetical protein